ncbi:hypothetical protein [Streptomyces sp. W1SF4]|uniref:hypothetical protein n=1 Tax=Streptomyces sp. W1SF4 TaxID=2305220 RepID=UPI000F6FCEF7|nr:hypothetical protein [Streptomyces sp. W1SF4]AZM90402.1 hypothetical protein D1J60_19730 [Streptomyces sp. W1SF4]
MIAGTPVARWTWGKFGQHPDLVGEAVRQFLVALGVLTRHRLGVTRGGLVAVRVSSRGGRETLLRADFPVDASAIGAAGEAQLAESLACRIRHGMAAGEMTTVDLDAACGGSVETGAGAEPVEGLFELGVHAYAEYCVVDLTTFSDVWMPYDLRGRAQEAVCAANRPRLAAALAEIAEALGLETDPDDATWFGIPTESGVENHFEDDDGSPSDVWGRFEIPYRNRIFSQTPEFTPGYGRQASGPVRYVPVAGPQEVLGYLWASDAEGAASFEPRDAADLDAYRAGLVWLDRLQAAYDRGLSPSVALAELGRSPGDPVAGRPEAEAAVEVEEFGTLALLALE